MGQRPIHQIAEMRDKFLLLTKACDQKAMERLFERLQNIESERSLDWIKVAAKKKTGEARRGGAKTQNKTQKMKRKK